MGCSLLEQEDILVGHNYKAIGVQETKEYASSDYTYVN